MKKFLLLSLLVSFNHLAAQVDSIREIGGSMVGVNYGNIESTFPLVEDKFRVSKVAQPNANETREKLLEIFTIVQHDYTTGTNGVLIPKPSLVDSRKINTWVKQVLSPSEFLFDDFEVKTILPHPDWIDGQLVILDIKKTDPFSYTAASGAKRTIQGYTEVGTEPPPTQAEFIAALKKGQTITVQLLETRDTNVPNKSGGLDLKKVRSRVNYSITW